MVGGEFSARIYLGVDTEGTFTDLAEIDPQGGACGAASTCCPTWQPAGAARLCAGQAA